MLEDLKDDPFLKRFKKLNEAMVGIVEDYSLVSFSTLQVQVPVILYLEKLWSISRDTSELWPRC